MFLKRARQLLIRISLPGVCQFFICIYLFKILRNYNASNNKKTDGNQIYNVNKPEIVIKKQPEDQKSNSINIEEEQELNIDYESDIDLLNSYLDININDIL